MCNTVLMLTCVHVEGLRLVWQQTNAFMIKKQYLKSYLFSLLFVVLNIDKQPSNSCLNALSIKKQLLIFVASMLFPLHDLKAHEHSEVGNSDLSTSHECSAGARLQEGSSVAEMCDKVLSCCHSVCVSLCLDRLCLFSNCCQSCRAVKHSVDTSHQNALGDFLMISWMNQCVLTLRAGTVADSDSLAVCL